MIELLNFILYNQDFNEPVSILLCTIDFSKAFNRINHNGLIVMLSDMEVPGWLLHVVMGFLADRELVVRYCKETSETMKMPGGAPQGTLLGLLMFLVLINACGDFDCNLEIGKQITAKRSKFVPSSFYAKFVDDMSIAEAINVKDPTQPLMQTELSNIKNYAEQNQMKFNFDKINLIKFNPTKSIFDPEIKVNNKKIEPVKEIKILGFTLNENLSWKSNTKQMTSKAYKRLWIVRRLLKLGACKKDLIDIYEKQVRSILEYGSPVWNSALTQQEITDIERVQKTFLHIILGRKYINYDSALLATGLCNLADRRKVLCKKFATKASKNPKHSHWFVKHQKTVNTRNKKNQFKMPFFRNERFRKSPITYLTKLLNS